MTRSEAKAQGMKYYFTGALCKNGHMSEKSVSNYLCVECQKVGAQKYRAEHPDRVAERHREYYESNKDRYRLYDRKQKETKRELLNERQKLRYRSDIERSRELRRAARSRRASDARLAQRLRYQKNLHTERARARDFRRRNLAQASASNAFRRFAKLKATPPWADLLLIREFYVQARRLTLETNIKHEVDHIVPLISKEVCGLHTQANLRVITAAENSSKKNRLIEALLS
jgi:hypothetical protein